jgi:hypothetical protein
LSALIGAACASSQGERAKQARLEEAAAQEAANLDAVERQGEARRRAIETKHEAAQATPAGERRPDESAASQERALYHSEAKTRVDKLAVRLDVANQQITALGARATSSLKQELQTVLKEHTQLSRDVDELRAVHPDDWASTTELLERRIAGLDQRVSQLSDAIGDV